MDCLVSILLHNMCNAIKVSQSGFSSSTQTGVMSVAVSRARSLAASLPGFRTKLKEIMSFAAASCMQDAIMVPAFAKSPDYIRPLRTCMHRQRQRQSDNTTHNGKRE